MDDPIHDSELARRMASGDRAAFAAVYEAHRDSIYTAVRRLVGSNLAPDVTHDAFIVAFARAADFRGSGSLIGWIRRIAVNLALREIRRDRITDRLFPRLSPPLLARPASSEAIDLERAIGRLPRALRSPFILHSVEGYTHGEIALLLGISAEASRQRVHRARARLARDLRGGEER